MFGPNSIVLGTSYSSYHHRSNTFRVLYSDTKKLFRDKFSIDDNWEILFITGSGTTANEIVLSSSIQGFIVEFSDKKFGGALKDLNALYHGNNFHYANYAYVKYETSCSRLNCCTFRDTYSGLIFCDMVSAFPFYSVDYGVNVWTTVSSKQFGSMPIMGIIVLNKNILGHFVDDFTNSCLSLKSYLVYSKTNEMPHTPTIGLLEDFYQRLHSFDLNKFTEDIIRKVNIVQDYIPVDYRIGEGPVITIRKSCVPVHLASAYDLYCSDLGYQLFLWSGTENQYKCFCMDWVKYYDNSCSKRT